jgi:hypothetical protein
MMITKENIYLFLVETGKVSFFLLPQKNRENSHFSLQWAPRSHYELKFTTGKIGAQESPASSSSAV